VDILQGSKGVENACWVSELGDQAVGDINDCDRSGSTDVLADMRFCVEVTKTPA